MTTAASPMPASTTPATRLSDAAIADELAALRRWARRHLVADGAHSSFAPADYLVRVSQLAHVQKQRRQDAELAARRLRERQAKDANESRAQVGAPRRNPDDTLIYPVSCAEHGHLGTVRRAYARSRKWTFTRADNGSSGMEYASRREAAGALVWLGDLAAAAAGRQRRQNAACSTAPDGWEFGDWGDLTEFDIIRTPHYGRAEDGTLYPRGWSEKAEVRCVNDLGGGRMVISLVRPDGSYADPLFVSDQKMKAVGFLWPAGRVRPQPQPHREKLRVRCADIGDDIATVRRRLGDTDRVQRLAALIARLERADTQDLFADLRRMEAETGLLRAQVSDRHQPYEIREIKSWAVAAHIKARQALEVFATDPDFAWAVPAAA